MKSISKTILVARMASLLAIGSALAQASSGQTGGGDAKQQDAPSSSGK